MSLNRTKFLEPSEVLRLRQNLTSCRDTVLLRLALETGCRASEVLAIKRSDLYPDTCTVLIHTLKGGNDRELPVLPDLMDLLLIHVPFNIGYDRFYKIWLKYRPCNKSLHSLRHTFAIDLYRRTKDLKLVQLALGHRRISTTSVYQDFEYSREEMRRILPVNSL